MNTVKVYEGLNQVERDIYYHLGHYEIDFEDGPLRFEVLAQICGNPECICDELAIEWRIGPKTIRSWYTAEREWLDPERNPVPDEMEQVFRNIESEEVFQERVQHLLFLRRRMVLHAAGHRDGQFQVTIPTNILLDGHQLQQGILGKIRVEGRGGEKAMPFAIEFCNDQSCYCSDMFLLLDPDENATCFAINPEDEWRPNPDTPTSRRLLPKVKSRVSRIEKFRHLLDYLRMARRMENYHRFVSAYQESLSKSLIS